MCKAACSAENIKKSGAELRDAALLCQQRLQLDYASCDFQHILLMTYLQDQDFLKPPFTCARTY